MQLSVSRFGMYCAPGPKTWALTAFIAVSLLVALGTELSHVHEPDELAYECEICMEFKSSDELLAPDRLTFEFEPGADSFFLPGFSFSDTQIIRTRSRAPPVPNSALS